MKWLVILSGAHWRDIVPELFLEHQAVKDWSIIECDEIDVTGEMVELRCRDVRILVPYGTVVTAITAQAGPLSLVENARGRH
ncbi:hypothetical protein GCT13_41120 [Paraburkholderia sp. CNPSo 3157]|uniref:Uncharacterized protein n=1 Tax=Paraburkholderia franconis TaxID=2654983 RepID=A0A7X1NJE6_9BURK|nr:hypothetical protein [Paraburkholderia franconis]MPW23014.1 hypothetical protein [Paraburkholderia franconis]